MSSEALTLYKMMVLYMLSLVEHPLTNAQISDFMLSKDYTDYFTLQTVFSELTDTDLIKCDKIRNASYYRITDMGVKTLKLFNDNLSSTIKEDISSYLKEHAHELKKQVSVLSDYSINNKGDHSVNLKLIDFDGSILLDLSLAVPSEERAIEICNEWNKKSDSIYSYLMNNIILKPRKK
jgi:DNA-binding PadR family transcriptional regulator